MVCVFAHVKTALPWATALIAIGYGIYMTYKSCKSAGCSGRCNSSIDLNNAKVVTTVDIEDINKKEIYCRCWKSKKFPLCDGSHNKHNETTGDNVGPLIVQKHE